MSSELQKITYNVENLRTQVSALRSILDELTEAKEQLRTSLDSLKGEWQSDAATKFFSTYDTKWMEKVQDYEQRLEDLIAALTAAANEYGALASEYRTIRLG